MFLTAAVIVDDLVAIGVIALFYAASTTVILRRQPRRGRPDRPQRRNATGRPMRLVSSCGCACTGRHPRDAGRRDSRAHHAHAPAAEPVRSWARRRWSWKRRPKQRRRRHGHAPRPVGAHAACNGRDPRSHRIAGRQAARSVEPWSSYLVLPLFAFANAGVALSIDVVAEHGRLVLAIVLGLVLGKLLGILGAGWLAVRTGVALKPATYSWRQVAGAGALAGIGFTMSLFTAGHAFGDAADFARPRSRSSSPRSWRAAWAS